MSDRPCDKCGGTGRLPEPEAAEVEHSCQWCEINPWHPNCPQNENEPRCPVCGSDPEDVTMHTGTCRTLGTCASSAPDLPEPWHPEPEGRWSMAWLAGHLVEHHADYVRKF